jgi:hypothetical protein
MQIAARWIDAQRPLRGTELLPGGQTQRVAQEVADDVSGARVRQKKIPRAGVRTEGIRLGSPVEIARRPGKAIEVVLGAVVIVANG